LGLAKCSIVHDLLMFPCHAGLDPEAMCVGSGQNAFEVAVVVSVSLRADRESGRAYIPDIPVSWDYEPRPNAVLRHFRADG